jgi:DNA-binding transcriptional regulator GbsR (MarR family)
MTHEPASHRASGAVRRAGGGPAPAGGHPAGDGTGGDGIADRPDSVPGTGPERESAPNPSPRTPPGPAGDPGPESPSGAPPAPGGGADAGEGAGPASGTAPEPAAESAPGAESLPPDDPRVTAFVERFAAQLVEAGMARMPARVFAALLSSDSGTLTSAELAARLRISPAAVSGAVRYLAQTNMLSREREPGSRRERYRVHADQWYEALTNREQILRRWEETLRIGVASLGADTSAGRRLAETREFFRFVDQQLGEMMARWRELRDQRVRDGQGE